MSKGLVAVNFVIRTLALFDPEIRTIVSSLDQRTNVTAERARRELGVTFGPAAEAIVSAGRFLVDQRLV